MAEDYKKLAQGTLTGDGSTVDTLYTVPSATDVIVKEIRIVNYDTSNHWIRIHDVDSGGTAGDANLILPELPIEAGGLLTEYGEITPTADDALKAVSDGVVTYTLYGVEVS